MGEKKLFRVKLTREVRQKATLRLWATSLKEAIQQAPKWPVRWENIERPEDIEVVARIEEAPQ